MNNKHKYNELFKLYIEVSQQYIDMKADINLHKKNNEKYLKDTMETNLNNTLNKMSLYLDLLIDTQERIKNA